MFANLIRRCQLPPQCWRYPILNYWSWPKVLLRASCSACNASVKLIFSNSKGIPAELLPRVFNPFFTTKPIGKATGLAVSYQSVVEHHGGRLDWRSQAGQGTEVSIELPLRLPAASPSRAAAERPSVSLNH